MKTIMMLLVLALFAVTTSSFLGCSNGYKPENCGLGEKYIRLCTDDEKTIPQTETECRMALKCQIDLMEIGILNLQEKNSILDKENRKLSNRQPCWNYRAIQDFYQSSGWEEYLWEDAQKTPRNIKLAKYRWALRNGEAELYEFSNVLDCLMSKGDGQYHSEDEIARVQNRVDLLRKTFMSAMEDVVFSSEFSPEEMCYGECLTYPRYNSLGDYYTDPTGNIAHDDTTKKKFRTAYYQAVQETYAWWNNHKSAEKVGDFSDEVHDVRQQMCWLVDKMIDKNGWYKKDRPEFLETYEGLLTEEQIASLVCEYFADPPERVEAWTDEWDTCSHNTEVRCQTIWYGFGE